MSTKVKIPIILVSLMVSFMLGRITTRHVETINEHATVDDRKEKTVAEVSKKVRITRPDGTVEESEEKGTTITFLHDVVAVTDKQTHEENGVTGGDNGVVLSFLYPITLNPSIKQTYGLHVSKNFLGPVQVGVFGFTDGKLGVSAGISF